MRGIQIWWLIHVVSLFFMALLLSGCAGDWWNYENRNRGENFAVNFWQTPSSGDKYPEMDEQKISSRRSFGVAFQGGGNRAAPAALGQLRALHDLGWINHVRYVAAVSGGAWAAIPYTFLKKCPASPNVNCDERRFLGVSQSAQEVARRLPELSKEENPKEFEKGTMLGAISESSITKKVIRALLHGRFDESFSEALGEIYLAPFGLGRSNEDEPDSLFTWRKTDRDAILKDNQRFSTTKIHYVERERPYLIVGGTLLTKRTLIEPGDKFRMEMTPLYSGVPRRLFYPAKRKIQIQVGGGFIESFGYDYVTDSVDKSVSPTKLTLRDPVFGNRSDPARLNFSLSNMAAVSGAAPVETTVSIRGLRLLAANSGFPEHFVPVDQKTKINRRVRAKKGETIEKEWSHGDGGHEDNLGLAPLLARHVENILVFANSHVPLRPDNIDECERGINYAPTVLTETKKLSEEIAKCIEMIGGDIPSFFVKTKKQIHNVGLRLVESKVPNGRKVLGGYYDLLKVAKQLQSKDGLSCNRYRYTPENIGKHKSAAGGSYSPVICILFLGLDRDWVRQIKRAAQEQGQSKNDIRSIQRTLDLYDDWSSNLDKGRKVGSKDFPHIATFLDKPGYLIKTDRSRLFALSNFTSWKLKKHRKDISKEFAKTGMNFPKK